MHAAMKVGSFFAEVHLATPPRHASATIPECVYPWCFADTSTGQLFDRIFSALRCIRIVDLHYDSGDLTVLRIR